MKKRLLLSTLLALGIGLTVTQQSAHAISQTVTASLAGSSTISVKSGQSVSTTMDGSTGALGAALTPGFTVFSNQPKTLSLTATVATSASSNVNALGVNSGGTTYYLALGNTTEYPTSGAVSDAISTTDPTDPANNEDVVSYALTGVPSSGTGIGTFAWSTSGGNHFEASIAHAANGNVILTTVTAARGNTFSATTDEAGDYQANITLSFI